jgi:hypothetical protein
MRKPNALRFARFIFCAALVLAIIVIAAPGARSSLSNSTGAATARESATGHSQHHFAAETRARLAHAPVQSFHQWPVSTRTTGHAMILHFSRINS